MAITKTVKIDEKEVVFRASAAVPRLYRNKFGRDIYKDLNDLSNAVIDSDEDESTLDTFNLEIFENLAWLMAYHADPQNVPDSVDKWLDQFDTFSIYQILPEIIDLWGMNMESEAEAKKNSKKLNAR